MNEKQLRKWEILWGAILLLSWGLIIVFFIHNHGELSVSELLSYKPDNDFLAVLGMLGLFLLKSVDFIMYSGVLYAADGIMFPMWAAILLNLVGSAIIVTTPYWIGRTLGRPLLDVLKKKQPKLGVIDRFRLESDFVTTLLLRFAGLPYNFTSLYLGAINMRFPQYLAGSVLGMMPLVVNYTVLGMTARDPKSPAFLITVGIHVVLLVSAVLIYRLLMKKTGHKTVQKEQEDERV